MPRTELYRRGKLYVIILHIRVGGNVTKLAVHPADTYNILCYRKTTELTQNTHTPISYTEKGKTSTPC